MIAKRASVHEIRTQAVKEGMTTLLQDGIRKVVAASSTSKPSRRYASSEPAAY